jgi:type II secretory pathway component PulF
LPTFVYKALDPKGHEVSETITEASRDAVIDQLMTSGLVPISVDQQEDPMLSSQGLVSRSRRVTKSDVESFIRELANLLAAGVPLSRSLNILGREASNKAAGRQWAAIRDCVADGMSLADSLARWPKSFPPVYVAMVRAGETGGFLDLVLGQIANFQSREQKLLGKVKAATIYPIILAVLGILIVIFLTTFFIPRFSAIFEEFGGALPWLTLVIVGASEFMMKYWMIILGVVVLIGLGMQKTLASEEGRRVTERLLLQVPLFGSVVARFALVRFCRMLGTLVGAGVPLVSALQVANEAIGNQTLADAVSETVKKVRNGGSLAAGMAGCPQLFPPSVIEMISVAEETGRLDEELVRMASAFEEDLDQRLSMLVAQAEPALLFIMAAIVGTIIIGMLLPIFSLQELIR